MKGIFGMNITELTTNGPPAKIALAVAVPGTVILFVLIVCGKFVWTRTMGRAKSGGDLNPLPYFNVGDGGESRTFSSIRESFGTESGPLGIAPPLRI
jgi:hypothetical protein